MATRRGDDEPATDYFTRLHGVETDIVKLGSKQTSHEDICAMRYAGIESAVKSLKDNIASLQYWGVRAVIGLGTLILMGGHAFLKAALDKCCGIQLP